LNSLAIIAGTPQWLFARTRRFQPIAREGWDFRQVDSRRRSVELETCWPEVVALANDSLAESVHIFSFFAKRSERQRYRNILADRHRLVWLEKSLQDEYLSGGFGMAIDRLIDFEVLWSDRVRPPDIHHPLMLPECAFSVEEPLDSIWLRARDARLGGEPLENVRSLLDSFKKAKLESAASQPNCWKDDQARLFKFPRPTVYHASPQPNSQRWKFAFKFPQGFHFDVSSAKGRPFSVTDCMGTTRAYLRWTNVDPLGSIRGGE
jgi:hypothetical protein